MTKPFVPAQVGARVDAAVRVKRRLDALIAASRTDLLTSLPNRRAVEEELEGLLAVSRRHEQPLSFAMVDIDLFKAVNDTYGHAFGDATLAAMAVRMSRHLRQGDVLGRWGGEEFAVVMPVTGVNGARSAAERLRAGVAVEPLFIDGRPCTITVSVGCATSVGEADPNDKVEYG